MQHVGHELLTFAIRNTAKSRKFKSARWTDQLKCLKSFGAHVSS